MVIILCLPIIIVFLHNIKGLLYSPWAKLWWLLILSSHYLPLQMYVVLSIVKKSILMYCLQNVINIVFTLLFPLDLPLCFYHCPFIIIVFKLTLFVYMNTWCCNLQSDNSQWLLQYISAVSLIISVTVLGI